MVIALPAATWAGGWISDAMAPTAAKTIRAAMRVSLCMSRDVVVVIYHYSIGLHVLSDIRRQIHCERDRHLRQQRLCNIPIRNPHDLPITIVVSGNNMRDVYDLAALISKLPTQDFFPQRIGLEFLLVHLDYRI